jgi:hypothetical protein
MRKKIVWSVIQKVRTKYRTSGPTVQELLHGHSERIRTELGVHKEVFHALIQELQSMGHGDSKYVTLEEQLAIFLYTSVTGLSLRHVGERFQRANGTISK